MGLIGNVCLVVVPIVAGVASTLVAAEFEDWQPSIVRRILSIAVQKLPVEQQERYAEE